MCILTPVLRNLKTRGSSEMVDTDTEVVIGQLSGTAPVPAFVSN